MLSNKTLIMLVGPSAMGKSTIMNAVVAHDTRFVRVRSFTTRGQRDNDEPGQYFYVTHQTVDELRAAGQIITSVEFPNTGDTYGTVAESYSGEYCLLDTLANSVQMYRGLPFQQTTTLSLTAPVDTWHEWFLQRFPTPSDEATKRLEEARLSIEWSLSQTQDHLWLVNDGTPDYAAQKLVGMFLHGLPGDDGATYAQGILERIQRGIWQ